MLNIINNWIICNNKRNVPYRRRCWEGDDIADKVKQYVDNGLLKYIKNTLPDCNLNKPGICDPNFWGINGTSDKKTATHGITANSYLERTNQ